ncbi:MAG TPA: glutamate synthase subunit alpha, partial [Roseiflexaceae bacterium]|nr:glutamate synthase subunit alpha [Roseiflexaceae bacterium]
MTTAPRHDHVGLYNPAFEHDACGIGFVARLSGEASHEIVELAVTAVGRMAHRGGVAADGKTGDGAGILTQIPRAFFARELEQRGIAYPAGDLVVAMCFLPQEAAQLALARDLVAQGLDNHGLEILAWRTVPTNDDAIGERALETKPAIEQALIGWRGTPPSDLAVRERKLYLARKQIEAAARAEQLETFYFSSLSGRTLVYKGMLVAPMLPVFYPDLTDPLFESAIAVYHQRYSTNTFPKWELAQPFRMLSHNGEINTLHGNLTWMQAREAEWRAAPAGNSLAGGGALAAAVMRVGQVIDTSGSDSAILDNALELAVQGGRDVRHALTMLVPEAWEQVSDMDP